MSAQLRTRYLGLDLKNPIVAGASPLSDDLDAVRRLEDAGASALVMRSLFEEQITGDQLGAHRHLYGHAESAEAQSWFPETDVFSLGPEEYLERVRKTREAISIPVIASLNGTTPGGWTKYAGFLQEAGAAALELNLYDIPTNPDANALDVELRQLEVVRGIREAVKLPVAVKLTPFYSSLPNMIRELERIGAQGAVLFNRFYQPDIDIENLEVHRALRLSDPVELPLRLRWLAILSPTTSISLAASGGVHEATDALKALMAGAHAVQVVSALLMRGPAHISVMLAEMNHWLADHEYTSIEQLQGSMNLKRCPDASHYERGNYMSLLQSWHVTPQWGR
ncbi:MAG: dihydroorotate dehydrogenase-like protein [Planctomycetes bacterium]|nr:dihydroorotate dehydrogenase-like protein [Planctomycetota bacterium]